MVFAECQWANFCAPVCWVPFCRQGHTAICVCACVFYRERHRDPTLSCITAEPQGISQLLLFVMTSFNILWQLTAISQSPWFQWFPRPVNNHSNQWSVLRSQAKSNTNTLCLQTGSTKLSKLARWHSENWHAGKVSNLAYSHSHIHDIQHVIKWFCLLQRYG